jgi:hypothetical protein
MKEVHIEGWKGKSSREIQENETDYKIIEYRKDKNTGEIKEQTTIIPKKNVEIMNKIIQNCEILETYGYRWVISKLKKHYNLTVDTEAWNGGKNRAKYYFPYHYYPLKVLESQGKIRYSGGKVMRLV